ncbi:MAG: chitobiase/beta-hexosaminidase C-terminal domain-containing protein [Kiritimatiellae bacterium]|nr:chitobiase/beta-hexosaminidase C-terminal domain-containing protein [Kiritimatiellia bacterium]
MKFKTMLAMALGALAAGFAAAGDLEVSAYWQDHMVLQRGKPITVWGKDAAGRTVTVSFAGQNANAVTGSDGFWETTFSQPFALSATPQALTITDSASESITLSDILVGDVFLAAGQSNMDRRLDYKDFHEPQSVKDFCRDDDGIRFIRIARSAENATSEKLFDLPPIKPVDDTIKYYGEGFDWAPATMNGAASNKYHVSSVALNFAHYIRRSNAEKGQDIPIGIIHASSGGTAIREWIAPSVLIANGIPSAGSTGSSDGWYWNNMMAPILRAKFRAFLWYQGCTDAAMKADDYKALMDVLVKDRRDRWGESGDLPFYAVQIAAPNYNSASGTIGLDKYPAPTEDNVGHNYVRVREAQRLWNMSDTGTHGLVTIVDCVDCLSTGSLHPTDKNFVGRRLSLLARRDIYGEPDLPAEGPVFTRAVREADGSVRIFFKSGTAKGLTAGRMKPASSVSLSQWVKKSTDPIRGFALCGSDNVWKDADATVEGETIVLRAADVATPTKFHYGYWCVPRETLLEDGQRLNLYNGSGLPMSPVAPQAVEDAATSAKVADPVLTPGSCFFSPSTNVTIACATSGATVRYTLDGSEPTASSAVYSAPIALAATTTVKARAFADGKEASDVVFATYTLGEAPAPEPDPLWEPGMYAFDEWTPLANNLLAGLTTTYTANSLYPWNGSVACLTDGEVSANLSDESIGIGIRSGSTLSWSFAAPKTIETIRLTACGYNHMYKYDKILVESVEVLQNGEWNQIGGSIAFNGPDSYGSDQSLYATIADEVTGRLATGVTGLRITFGDPKGLGYCRYGEIEASGYDSSGAPIATVATPTISPASCSFYPTTNVTLSCATEGAVVRYTLDGSNPTSSSAVYSAPISVSATTTVKARAFATDMNPSAVASATYTYTEPGNPPDDPPGESERTWTTGDYDPSTWTGLENNILAGLTAQEVSNPSKLSFAASKDLSKLTDGAVSATADSSAIVGLQPGAELVWTFDGPKVLEKIRFSSLWASSGKIYAGISVSNILVKTSGSSEWVSLGVSISKSGSSTAGGAQYAILSDPGLGYLALDVVALKFVSGSVEAFANYYGEIEAVGRVSSEAYPPALGALTVKPWGTSAEFSGSIASVGTSASSCDVYLAYGSDADHLGEPVKIHTGNAGVFHYELEGLALATAYSYRLSVSNNAETVLGCEATGSFTTTSEVHPDWSSYKWAVIGDSLTDPTLAPGIGSYYYNFVAADTGIQLVYTNGVGSTGYKNKYNVDGGKCFYQRLQASPLPSDVDVVTIFGSVNDWGQAGSDAAAGEATDSIDDGKDTLAAYMNKAIDVIQAQAPSAKIVLVGSLYYYNVVASSHQRANETLRAVAAQRNVAFYDWLTENPNDPLDFHNIADDPTADGSFAQRYTRDCPTEIIQGETSFGHPSAEYHEVWLSPHFRGVLTAALSDAPAPLPTVATPVLSPDSCNFYPSTNVTVSCTTEGATIRYTLDGSDPTAESAAYAEPIVISATTTVKARAFADEMNPSAIVSATYTLINPSTPITPGTWTTNVLAPGDWSPLANNLLAGMAGTISGATAGSTYGSKDPALMTDSSVPTAGGAAWIIGFQNNSSIEWSFGAAKRLDRVRISCGYLAQTGYSGFNVSAVEVQTSGSTEWTAVSTTTGQMLDTKNADILAVTLVNESGAPLAANVVALRVTFATPPVGFANYCAEIEAVGTSSSDKSYPEWIDETSQTVTAKYDAWAAKFSVTDPTAAQHDAYLLNCANTADAVAAAKEAFTVVSIAINADGTVDVGMPAAPEGGFNGTVAILGCETVNGDYHTVTTGSLQDALYKVPATSSYRFFKAALE